jgi:ornithine carbamoyltransferase
MLTLRDYTKEEILQIIDDAIEIKSHKEKYSELLKGKNLLQIYQKTSTRTVVSFAFAVMELGGSHFYLPYTSTNFSISEDEVEAETVSRYVDIIVARYKQNKALKVFAKGAKVPVINGCDDKYHPCQILGDFLTIKEKFGSFEDLKVVYVGLANNISNSLSTAAAKIGVNFTLCSPEFDLDAKDLSLLEELRKSPFYTEETDIHKAIKNANVIYTDTWINMEVFTDPKFKEEKERRVKKFIPYQINPGIMKITPEALVMHNMPVHMDYEITKDVVYSKSSIIMDQAENRKHIQKAVLPFLLGIKIK